MKKQQHFQWIDFLRGLSALGIILYHVRVNLWAGWAAIRAAPASYSAFDRAASWLSVPLPFFGSAVMLFFLVSGFCIHYPHAAEGRPLALRAYSGRRLLRIYPPYLAAVLFGVFVEAVLSHVYQQPRSSTATMLKSLFMVQNFGLHAGQMAANPSLWSLPVEVELYAAYPLFLWLLTRRGGRWAMGMAAAVSLLALGLSFNGSVNALLNITNHFALYWIIWCAGAMLAEKVRKGQIAAWTPRMSLGMASLFLVAMLCSLRHLPSGVIDLAWAGFYFGVLYWGLAAAETMPSRVRQGMEKLAPLGLISYSLYLIHFPLFKLCGAVWVSHFGTKPANLLVPIGFCGMAVLLAYLVYLCIEAPSHRFAQKFGRQSLLAKGQSLLPIGTPDAGTR